MTPLHMAASGNHFDIVRHLVEKKACIDIQDKSGVSTIDALLICNSFIR